MRTVFLKCSIISTLGDTLYSQSHKVAMLSKVSNGQNLKQADIYQNICPVLFKRSLVSLLYGTYYI